MKRLIAAAIVLSATVIGFSCKSGTEAESTPAGEVVVFDHSYMAYGEVLSRVVDAEGLVDYRGLSADRGSLDQVVAALEAVKGANYETFSDDEKLAYWINAYNALTLRAVAEAYPVESIKDIDGVWDGRRYDLAGRTVTINDIEHKILRRQFDEPRIHFTINCASVSCPQLWGQPFTADALDRQISDATTRFLADPRRNRFAPDERRVQLSEIFTWFGTDFEKYFVSPIPKDQDETVRAVLSLATAYLPDSLGGFLMEEGLTVETITYDWGLNEQR